jgi:DNA repair exonuclease SbcCD ATPase subunit
MSEDDFMSNFKKSINDTKGAKSGGGGKSVIENLQNTIKERDGQIAEKDETISELEEKIRELSVMAKDALLTSPMPGKSTITAAAGVKIADENETLKKQIERFKKDNEKLQENLKKLKGADYRAKQFEKKIDAQKKEISELKQKKDFDLAQFIEEAGEGDDPALASQNRVLKTRVKSLEKKIEDNKIEDLKETITQKEDEIEKLEDENMKFSFRVKDLEADIDLLQTSPPPPAPPPVPTLSGKKKKGPPEPPGFQSSGPLHPPFASSSSMAGAGSNGGGAELKALQKQVRELQEKYDAALRDVDDFNMKSDPKSLLNMKSRRIEDLEDQVKALTQQMHDNPELKNLRNELQQKDKYLLETETAYEEQKAAVDALVAERDNIIAYYNDLKQKYEQIYAMIQERDRIIIDLQARLQG